MGNKVKSFEPMGMHELQQQSKLYPVKYTVKWVKKASQWCRTYFKNGQQIQEWYPTKEEAERGKDEV